MRIAKSKYRIIIALLGISIIGCKPQESKEGTYDSSSKGTINISVDESFKPVIEEQIAMYHESYPETKIVATYKPEAECIKDLFRDTAVRTVIITRALTEKESKYFRDTLGYTPGNSIVATDAIAIVVNSASNDTLFTLERLRDQLSGKINRQQKIVFDGLSATSTLRFVMDSVLKGQPLDTSVVKASRTSNDVLEFVANDKDAIGLVGISWIGNPEIPSEVAMLKRVKIGYVRCDICDSMPYVKPMQASILTRRYPLVRGLYYVNKEGYAGLGTGFVNFMKNERGQLIFRRAYLGPIMELGIRNLRLNEKMPKK